ncbi:hypothetical protein [Nodularia sp. NIES-3585]|uniref:hypothetical protein n=1 Tax=Nodularia sp. NIES-3585 TaxID=1973477 RepID=UPI000B703915|nr:hypothetical protein [Nodularia sp. NIES-3585]GAX37311.1 hypothetical protein NIES3585_33540 [Nodularia sp. NIES-3585]
MTDTPILASSCTQESWDLTQLAEIVFSSESAKCQILESQRPMIAPPYYREPSKDHQIFLCTDQHNGFRMRAIAIPAPPTAQFPLGLINFL